HERTDGPIWPDVPPLVGGNGRRNHPASRVASPAVVLNAQLELGLPVDQPFRQRVNRMGDVATWMMQDLAVNNMDRQFCFHVLENAGHESELPHWLHDTAPNSDVAEFPDL